MHVMPLIYYANVYYNYNDIDIITETWHSRPVYTTRTAAPPSPASWTACMTLTPPRTGVVHIAGRL